MVRLLLVVFAVAVGAGCTHYEYRARPSYLVTGTVHRAWVETFDTSSALLGYAVGANIGKGYGGTGFVVGGLAGAGDCYMSFSAEGVTTYSRVVPRHLCDEYQVGSQIELIATPRELWQSSDGTTWTRSGEPVDVRYELKR